MARKYDHEYKVQAVKLAKEIGGAKAAKELGIPEGTIHTWLKAVRAGRLDIGEGSHTPASAMSLSEEITMLRKRVKDQDDIVNISWCLSFNLYKFFKVHQFLLDFLFADLF